MAVNLLAIANQMRGNLHNSPSGSRTRSSDANEPGNLPSSGSIPGTNINQDAGIRSVARKGRRGDTELRRVGGEVSHVNTTEANAIDMLGPMGEAWVKSVGSGTRNPKTGLPEYSWLSKGISWVAEKVTGVEASQWDSLQKSAMGTWKPSEGKWGMFGSTKASKERDKAKRESKVRHKQFEKFRRDYEDQNIAGIFTEDKEGFETDDTDLTAPYAGQFNNFITDKSGMGYPGSVESNDIADYLDEYDPRKENEAIANMGRDLEKQKLVGEGLTAQDKSTGSGLSSGLFGMLTQSQDTASQQNFAGKGDFAADFAEKQAVKEAESQFGSTERDREGLEIDMKQTVADAATQVQDAQDDYNQEFWENMMSWDTAINS